MKKVLVCFLFCLPFLGIYAQSGDFYLGAKIVPGTSFIINQNNFEVLFPYPDIRDSEMAYDFTASFAGGFTFGYYSSTKKWGGQAELLYNRAGQRYSDTYLIRGEDISVSRNVVLHYLQIPLKAVYRKRSRRDNWGFYTGFGPYLGFELAEQEDVTYDPIPSDSTQFEFTGRKFGLFDLGVALEAGFEFRLLSSLYLSAGLDVAASILDINSKAVREIGWHSKNDDAYTGSRNFRAGISLGVNWYIGRQYY